MLQFKVTTEPHFGERFVLVYCPNCKVQVITLMNSIPAFISMKSKLLLIKYHLNNFSFRCDFGCCLIPFCIEPCLDIEHSCPRCGKVLGRLKRL
ncbi:unnamed protein product [Hymenolepis diminuta]|uniref:LITAF domain-containing protein n=1 Tax=Hymenolepis diminuta TaxID=6216 RepID=A0A0R3SY20_HYMDI|nr:unnamed protein product [Hymenolepis diminuta]